MMHRHLLARVQGRLWLLPLVASLGVRIGLTSSE